MKVGGTINIMGAKIILWVDHVWTRHLLVRTRPTEECHILTRFQLEQKFQSLRHWHDKRNFQNSMEKRTYQGNRVQTHHRQTHNRNNLICRKIAFTLNRLKIKLIGRKSVVNTRKKDASDSLSRYYDLSNNSEYRHKDIKRGSIRKHIRSNDAHG